MIVSVADAEIPNGREARQAFETKFDAHQRRVLLSPWRWGEELHFRSRSEAVAALGYARYMRSGRHIADWTLMSVVSVGIMVWLLDGSDLGVVVGAGTVWAIWLVFDVYRSVRLENAARYFVEGTTGA